ncbi:MAG: aminodeoxychorismate synthase component I [Alcaligenaceae bacterium]|nr:aminodeoxychorismate synthase component I [Alcaligenaceae bacterium]
MLALCDLHRLPYQADPNHYFERIHREPGAVLLDSGRPVAERGRFDILSAWPLEAFAPQAGERGNAFFARLRRRLATLGAAGFEAGIELPFAGGLLGYLAYDFGRRLEADAHAPGAVDDLQLPDARLGIYDWSLTSDHLARTSYLVFHPACPPERRQRLIALFESPPDSFPQPAPTPVFTLTGEFQPTISRNTYRQAIERIHAYIQAGDCYQVNYTQRFQAGYRGHPWAAYQTLRQACATPFAGYLNLGGDNAILSLSPERFIRLREGRIEARPIKGTRPRSADPAQDRMLAEELCASLKDRAENLMIVDLLRNDIGRSSRIGSVHVPELFSLESYPNVHHLVSSVAAELAPGLDAFDLLAGSFPGGSITGAPKIRAMQIIDELEPHQRSLYCGSLLYIDTRGNMDSSITIRSMLARNGRISCWAGGGIVTDSDWADEYQESLDKVDVLLKALQAR